MNPLTAIRIALDALFVNKGRSALTSLGIVIGITAVIAMVTAGAGARDKLDERLESVGKNLILVQSGGKTQQGIKISSVPLTPEDAQALRDDPRLKAILVGVAESQHWLTLASTGTGNHGTSVTGGMPEIFRIRNWKLASGRFYTDADIKSAHTVCLLGDTVRKKLFPYRRDLRDERVRVGNHWLTVIGTLEPKGRAPTGADQDDQIFVPITTLQDKLTSVKRFDLIVAAAVSEQHVEPAVRIIRQILRDRHRLKKNMDDDFDVTSVQELSEVAIMLTNVLNTLIVIIASISLIVGGIGIMNIMLVSVTERTREIGIRMAVGATTRDVRNQFLIEAVVLAAVGGAIGITLGIGTAFALAHFAGWPFNPSPLVVLVAFGVAAAVGVFFGYFPAVKASRLDPIEALRYE